MEKFAERLNELFERTGTTRRALAHALGVSERMIQYYITGAKDPTAETLVAIADFFDVSLDYLTGRSDDPTPPARDADEPPINPEDMAFFEWVKEHVTGMHFYDFQRAMQDQAWLKGLRVIYEKEKGRKPGQKQGE